MGSSRLAVGVKLVATQFHFRQVAEAGAARDALTQQGEALTQQVEALTQQVEALTQQVEAQTQQVEATQSDAGAAAEVRDAAFTSRIVSISGLG